MPDYPSVKFITAMFTATRSSFYRLSSITSQRCWGIKQIPKFIPRIRPVCMMRCYSQNRRQSFPGLDSSQHHSFYTRLRKLTREYGYTVMGVYVALSFLDFPLCFLAVKLLGEQRVAHAEHKVVDGVRSVLRRFLPRSTENEMQEQSDVIDDGNDKSSDSISKADPTIWTQLALAFMIHKSFIFVRVPLTAAITPKVVKKFRGWGYDIGQRKSK